MTFHYSTRGNTKEAYLVDFGYAYFLPKIRLPDDNSIVLRHYYDVKRP